MSLVFNPTETAKAKHLVRRKNLEADKFQAEFENKMKYLMYNQEACEDDFENPAFDSLRQRYTDRINSFMTGDDNEFVTWALKDMGVKSANSLVELWKNQCDSLKIRFGV